MKKAIQILSFSLIILLTVIILSALAIWYESQSNKFVSANKQQTDILFEQIDSNIILSDPIYNSTTNNISVTLNNKGTSTLKACNSNQPESISQIKTIDNSNTICIKKICSVTGPITIASQSFSNIKIPTCNLSTYENKELELNLILQPNNIHTVPTTFFP